jgi:hypothetical protein
MAWDIVAVIAGDIAEPGFPGSTIDTPQSKIGECFLMAVTLSFISGYGVPISAILTIDDSDLLKIRRKG